MPIRPDITRYLLIAAIVAMISSLATAEGDAINPAAQLPAGGDASEYWDLAIGFRSGHAIFARFMITNEGPSKGNGIAVGHLVDPDGNTTKFRNGRLRKRWELSSDRLRLDIGKSHLDLHSPGWQLLVRKSEVKLDIRVEASAGARIPAAVTGPRYQVDLLGLGAPAKGSIWTEDMAQPLEVAGRATLVHAVLQDSEADLVWRRVEAISQMGDYPLYFCEFRNPKGRTRSWTARKPDPAKPGVLWHHENAPDQASIKFGGKKPYFVPREITIQSANRQDNVQIGKEILRHNPLEDLPGPVRWILGMRMKPMRVWSTASFVGTLGADRNPDPLQSGNRGMTTAPADTAVAEMKTASREKRENTGVVTTSYLNPK